MQAWFAKTAKPSTAPTPPDDDIKKEENKAVEEKVAPLSAEEKEKAEQYLQIQQMIDSDDESNQQLALMFLQSLEFPLDEKLFKVIASSSFKLSFWIEHAPEEMLTPYKKLELRHGFFKKYQDIFQFAEVLPHFISLEELDWRIGPYWNQYPLVRSAAKLPNLKKLELKDCRMHYLPDNIGEASNLEELNLFLNKLKELPDSFSQLTKLKKLNLADNEFRRFPKLLYYMDSLRTLDIHANPLQDISAKHFADLQELKELRLPKKIAHYYKEVLQSSMPNLDFSAYYWEF